MTKITNKTLVDLPLSVWLMRDTYNQGVIPFPQEGREVISVTSLMRPIRQQVLSKQVLGQPSYDVIERFASVMGQTIHDGIEKAWTSGDYVKSMGQLGYPQALIDRIRINPDLNTLSDDDVPVFLERRGYRAIKDKIITGQADFCINGDYGDFKYTSTRNYMTTNKFNDYRMQGSLYRWLMPDIITGDIMRIEFIFNDWSKWKAVKEPDYPQAPVAYREFTLLSLEETEAWINNRLDTLAFNSDQAQDMMIKCTDKELWRSPTTYGYYADPSKTTGRRTRVFDTFYEANSYKLKQGKGVVIPTTGKAKACEFCPANSICTQQV